MRYIDWNIKCYCDIEGILALLQAECHMEDCIIALQEVMPDRAEVLRERLSQHFSILYSVDERQPDEEFDTDNRRLGVMLLVSKDYEIVESGIFTRCLFPERTLYATVEKGGFRTKVATFHSITGVSFKMGKAVQFRSFAECIRDYKPDIISLDANEPQVDHYKIGQMEFFDQGDGGKGARLFFQEVACLGLVDAYATQYDPAEYVPGQPLAVSHVINNRMKRRYDFAFVRKEFSVREVQYLYEEACAASSDHAMIVVDL